MRPRDLPGARDAIAATCALATDDTFRWERTTLTGDPRLIFVTEDMTALLLEVADSIPDDTNIVDLRFPSVTGLVVFAHPIEGTDAFSGADMRVSGLAWGPINVVTRAGSERGVAIASFLGPHDHPAPLDDRVDRMWLPLGRTEWLFREPLGEYADREQDYYQTRWKPHVNTGLLAQSAIEDRRLLAALIGLMTQDRHITLAEWRPLSNKAKRRNGGTIERVTVADIAARPAAPPAEPGDTRSVQWTHRWWVSPHWRWQACGPNRSERRLILVSGHVKGPGDRPFVRKDRVWRLAKPAD